MAGQKITVRRTTILQDELNSMARLADELRWGGRALKVAAEISKPSPDFNRTVPMQRLAMAAANKDTLIPLLEGEAWPHHVRNMSIEALLVSYVMKTTGYGGTALKAHAERYLRSLEEDLKEGMPDTGEIVPIRILLAEGCMDTLDRANNASRDAKSRVETLMAEIILTERPGLIIVREYLADATIEGYTNLEL